MLLNVRRWGPPQASAVVCLHGIGQHGGVFEALGKRLARQGHSVFALDLCGHGASGSEPPWTVERHLRDVLETIASRGVERAAWVGHSFGGRVVATLAAAEPERVDCLVLLEPSLSVPPERALRKAEVDRLDWSFETVEGAANALLGSSAAAAAAVESYVREDLRRGADGLYRFSFCPAAAVTAWSELALPAPPVAPLRTLVVQAEASAFDAGCERRYRERLGELLSVARVPHGHNVLWESPAETAAAVGDFLDGGAGWSEEPVPGYLGEAGAFQPLL